MGTRDYCVYILTCYTTHKKYVGKTNDFNRRMNEHSNATDGETKLQTAIAQYGWDSFGQEIFREDLTQEEASRLETEQIMILNTYLDGYNMTSGGEG